MIPIEGIEVLEIAQVQLPIYGWMDGGICCSY